MKIEVNTDNGECRLRLSPIAATKSGVHFSTLNLFAFFFFRHSSVHLTPASKAASSKRTFVVVFAMYLFISSISLPTHWSSVHLVGQPARGAVRNCLLSKSTGRQMLFQKNGINNWKVKIYWKPKWRNKSRREMAGTAEIMNEKKKRKVILWRKDQK